MWNNTQLVPAPGARALGRTSLDGRNRTSTGVIPRERQARIWSCSRYPVSVVGCSESISLQDNGGLDRRYSIFGEIFRGIEIIDMIAKLPCDERDNPLEAIRMKVTVKE